MDRVRLRVRDRVRDRGGEILRERHGLLQWSMVAYSLEFRSSIYLHAKLPTGPPVRSCGP